MITSFQIRSAALHGFLSCLTARVRLCVAFAILASSLVPNPAAAYTIYTTESGTNMPLRWFSDTVQFEVSEVKAPGVETAALITLSQQGLGTWEVTSECTPSIVYSATTTDTDGSFEIGCDNTNVVVFILDANQWAAKGFSHLEIAKTTLMFSEENGEIVDADIELNAAGFTFSTGSPRNAAVDLLNTLTHEGGHLLGLDHSTDREATMYAQAPPEETIKRTLERDDIEGVCFLYEGFSPSQIDAVSYYEGACGGEDAIGSGDTVNTPPPPPPVVHDTHGCTPLPGRQHPVAIMILFMLVLSVAQRRRRLAPPPP